MFGNSRRLRHADEVRLDRGYRVVDPTADVEKKTTRILQNSWKRHMRPPKNPLAQSGQDKGGKSSKSASNSTPFGASFGSSGNASDVLASQQMELDNLADTKLANMGASKDEAFNSVIDLYEKEISKSGAYDLGLQSPTRTALRATCKDVLVEVSSYVRNKSFSANSRGSNLVDDIMSKSHNAMTALKKLITERNTMNRMGFVEEALELDAQIQLMEAEAAREKAKQEKEIFKRELNILDGKNVRRRQRVETQFDVEFEKLQESHKERFAALKEKQKREVITQLKAQELRAIGKAKSCSCANWYNCPHNKSTSFNNRRRKPDVITLLRNSKRLRQSGRVEEATIWEERALDLDSDHQDNWRKRIATSVGASPWGANEAMIDVLIQKHKHQIKTLKMTLSFEVEQLSKKRQTELHILDNFFECERGRTRLKVRNSLLAHKKYADQMKEREMEENLYGAREANFAEDLLAAMGEDAVEEIGERVKNLKKNFKFEQETEPYWSKFNERAEEEQQWVPPTAAGLDNSHVLVKTDEQTKTRVDDNVVIMDRELKVRGYEGILNNTYDQLGNTTNSPTPPRTASPSSSSMNLHSGRTLVSPEDREREIPAINRVDSPISGGGGFGSSGFGDSTSSFGSFGGGAGFGASNPFGSTASTDLSEKKQDKPEESSFGGGFGGNSFGSFGGNSSFGSFGGGAETEDTASLPKKKEENAFGGGLGANSFGSFSGGGGGGGGGGVSVENKETSSRGHSASSSQGNSTTSSSSSKVNLADESEQLKSSSHSIESTDSTHREQAQAPSPNIDNQKSFLGGLHGGKNPFGADDNYFSPMGSDFGSDTELLQDSNKDEEDEKDEEEDDEDVPRSKFRNLSINSSLENLHKPGYGSDSDVDADTANTTMQSSIDDTSRDQEGGTPRSDVEVNSIYSASIQSLSTVNSTSGELSSDADVPIATKKKPASSLLMMDKKDEKRVKFIFEVEQADYDSSDESTASDVFGQESAGMANKGIGNGNIQSSRRQNIPEATPLFHADTGFASASGGDPFTKFGGNDDKKQLGGLSDGFSKDKEETIGGFGGFDGPGAFVVTATAEGVMDNKAGKQSASDSRSNSSSDNNEHASHKHTSNSNSDEDEKVGHKEAVSSDKAGFSSSFGNTGFGMSDTKMSPGFGGFGSSDMTESKPVVQISNANESNPTIGGFGEGFGGGFGSGGFGSLGNEPTAATTETQNTPISGNSSFGNSLFGGGGFSGDAATPTIESGGPAAAKAKKNSATSKYIGLDTLVSKEIDSYNGLAKAPPEYVATIQSFMR